MIRPGKMRQTIILQRVARVPNAYGTEVETWTDLATLRAELVSDGDQDRPSETPGTRGRRAVTFRARHLVGVTLADRILWKGEPFDLVTITGGDFPEGRALDLACEGAA